MRQEDNDGVFIMPVVFTLLFAIAIICLIVWFMFLGPAKGAVAAPADPNCLTRAEARVKFPNEWLYYHGVNHCWDNVRKYAKPDRRGKGGRLDKSPIDPHGNEILPRPAPRKEQRASVFYPTMMGGGGTADNMLTPETMTTWPLVADFDVDPVPFLPWQRISALTNR